MNRNWGVVAPEIRKLLRIPRKLWQKCRKLGVTPAWSTHENISISQKGSNQDWMYDMARVYLARESACCCQILHCELVWHRMGSVGTNPLGSACVAKSSAGSWIDALPYSRCFCTTLLSHASTGAHVHWDTLQDYQASGVEASHTKPGSLLVLSFSQQICVW